MVETQSSIKLNHWIIDTINAGFNMRVMKKIDANKVERAFQEALRAEIDRRPHGLQVELAQKCGVKPQYINAIYKGRKPGSETVRRKIADALGYGYEEFLEMGFDLLGESQPKVVFLYADEVAHLAENSEERASKIYQLAGKEFGMEGLHWFTERAIRVVLPPGVQDYLDGKIDDIELFREARKELQRYIDLAEEHLRKRGRDDLH